MQLAVHDYGEPVQLAVFMRPPETAGAVKVRSRITEPSGQGTEHGERGNGNKSLMMLVDIARLSGIILSSWLTSRMSRRRNGHQSAGAATREINRRY
ncbi:hypothetical protein ACLB1Q_33230 [Escherichia coli]